MPYRSRGCSRRRRWCAGRGVTEYMSARSGIGQLTSVEREAVQDALWVLKLLLPDLCRKFPYTDPGDLYQSGFIGLVRGVRKFDPSRGIPFKKFLEPCIAKAARDGVFSSGCRVTRDKQLDMRPEVIRRPRGKRKRRYGPAASPPEIWIAQDEVHHLLATLPDRWRTIIQSLYFDEIPPLELGEKLGVNRHRISQIRTAALQRMREAAEAA